jgi:hypothetical protein
VFHPGNYLQRKCPNSRLTERIQIRFKRENKQLWMDDTQSFDELQQFLTATVLVRFKTLDVWVCVASLGAVAKGLRISTETQKLERLTDRGTPIMRDMAI